MTRKSKVTIHNDSAGPYEQEIFECENPKQVIIGMHGNGVRRWDGEKFYYQVAEHFIDSAVYLVDQNQPESGGCKLNSIDIMVERNQKLIEQAKKNYPDTPIWIVAHSMGCGIASLLDTTDVTGMIFAAPGVGDIKNRYIEAYGPDVVNGKTITTSDGYVKIISKEFFESGIDIIWQEKFRDLLENYTNVHVFESGDEDIVSEERFELRDMPFASYTIIDGATHNYSGKSSQKLFSEIDAILAS